MERNRLESYSVSAAESSVDTGSRWICLHQCPICSHQHCRGPGQTEEALHVITNAVPSLLEGMEGEEWGFYLTLEANKMIYHLHSSLWVDFKSEGPMQDLVVVVVDGHHHCGRQGRGWMMPVPQALTHDRRGQAWVASSFAEAVKGVCKRDILLAVTDLGIFFGQMFIHF